MTEVVYKVFTSVNYADTSRDADNIHTNVLGNKRNLEDAKELANKYIKKNFSHKNTNLVKYKDGTYGATDFRSYGETITIEPIKIT